MKKIGSHRFLFPVIFVFAVLLSVLAGFYATKNGISTLDDTIRYQFSLWLFGKYPFTHNVNFPNNDARWYAPLWDLFLVINTKFIFSFLNDPHWVRHALTWALYPLTLFCTYFLLRKAMISKITAFLCVSLLFSSIRFGGMVSQTKDFPAACAYILVTIGLWLLLYKRKSDDINENFSLSEIFLMTFLAVIPYLLRPPLLLHLGIIFLIICIYSVQNKNIPIALLHLGMAIIFSAALILILFPAMWDLPLWHLSTWTKPLSIFSKFPNIYNSRFFGSIYQSNALPWWYIFTWLPVFSHPFASVSVLVGLLLLIFRKNNSSPRGFLMPFFSRTYSISLEKWFAGILIVSWLLILIMQPSLYHGPRHVLFLYAPIPVLAGLGFKNTPKFFQIWLALMLISISIPIYVQWNRYAYIYTPNNFPITETSHFMGDSRLLCIPKAADYIQKNAPDKTIVVFNQPYDFNIQINRYRKSIFYKNLSFPDVIITAKVPINMPYWQISSSRFDMNNIQNISEEKIEILWQDTLPTGEWTCIISKHQASNK